MRISDFKVPDLIFLHSYHKPPFPTLFTQGYRTYITDGNYIFWFDHISCLARGVSSSQVLFKMVSKPQLKSSTPKRYIFQHQVCALIWAARRTPSSFCTFRGHSPLRQPTEEANWILGFSDCWLKLWSFWSCKWNGQIMLRLFIFSCLKIIGVIHWSTSWRGWRMYRKYLVTHSWMKCLQFGSRFVVLILRLNGTRHKSFKFGLALQILRELFTVLDFKPRDLSLLRPR